MQRAFFTKEEADTFDATVGIKNRYIASEKVCASDLCLDAAERLIAGLGWEKESIDVLLLMYYYSHRSQATIKHLRHLLSFRIDWDFQHLHLSWMFLWDVVVVCTV